MPSWSDIPLELAGLVLRLLPTYADRARFAGVCPQWRSAARQLPVPPPLPLLALPDGTFYSLPCTQPFRFPGCGFAGFNSACSSYLVFPQDDICFLVNPFSRATVTLPALSSVRLCPPNADLKNVPVEPSTSTWLHIKDKNLCSRKLLLCSPNLVGALINHGVTGQILVCQPGGPSWSVRAYDKCKVFEDMAFHGGKLCAVSHEEDLFVVSISQDTTTGSPEVSRIGLAIKGDGNPEYLLWTEDTRIDKKLYLVESHGALLMVRRMIVSRLILDVFVAERNEFQVFEADFNRSQWVNVMTLGDDQVLFLDRRCSQAVPVSQYGMPGDRIFFLDDDDELNFTNFFYKDDNASISVYDMTNQEVSSPLPTVCWDRDRMRLATWLLPWKN
ncbi:hypothetical protein QYE76_065882 [Lolium multiflorum]|uniref:DUF295 domain-containing protein n=1 Tax=Lolium multiflorum TaxID=4521 RepID=A0AAD8WBK5_LOLMU|nr:hypothetical protein QYE76_065882 [Lolium multiflorum]